MSKYIIGQCIDTHIKLSNTASKFGNMHIAGLQQKGIANIDGQDEFVKLDTLTPELKGKHWKPQFDYQYSSVSEAIVSCLTRNMLDDKLNSTDYRFAAFDLNHQTVTGTHSQIYLRENEVERILSRGDKTDTHVSISIDEYAAQVIDVKPQQRLINLTNLLVQNGVAEQTAHDFLVQQAGFDILTGNVDRLNNPSNFVIAFNKETKQGRPINLDYGRCLQINSWAQKMNDALVVGDEFYDEDVSDFADGFHKNDSIFQSYNVKDSIEQLKQNGFTPFNIDRQSLDRDLDELKHQITQSDVPCSKFAVVKIDAFKRLLDSDQFAELWTNQSTALSFDGLSESNVNLTL